MLSLKSKITQEVLTYFFVHESAAMYVNEMARRLKLDSGNLTRKLIQLESSGLLKSEIKGKQKYYSLNSSFPLLKEYRQITLQLLGLEHLLKESLEQVPNIKEAYLFGSYAENRMDVGSDIDLLTVGNHKVVELHKAISVIQRKIDREINLITLTPSEFENRRKTPFLKSVLQKPRIKLM